MSLNIGPINHMQILAKINMAERLHDQMENRQRLVIEKIIAEKVQENEKERMQTVKELDEAEKAGPGDREAREKDQREARHKKKEQDADESGTISEENRGKDGHIDFLA